MNNSASELFDTRTEDDILVETAVQLLPTIGKSLYAALTDIGMTHGLTPTQVKVLLQLGTHGQMTIGEIAAGLACSMPTASEVIDRLVDAGHLDRTTDPTDRRRVLIDATPAAARIAAQLHEQRRAQVRRALDLLAPEDRPIFVASLRALISALATDTIDDLPCPSAEIPDMRGNHR